MDMAEKIRLEKVEVEEDSNSPLFLKDPGSNLSIGRALCCPGDFTVSDHHVLLGLIKDGKKTLVEMKVEGPNPVCVLRHKTKPKVEFFEKGQSTFLKVGDQISLSVIKPVFWILKGEDTVAEIRAPEQTGNELESEEAGIAEAIARRKKLSLEREKKTIVRPVNQLKDEDLVDKPEGKEENFAALDTFNGNNYIKFDPVRDLGFLVEGQEFEKYRRGHKLDTRKWHCHMSSQHEVEDSDDETNETAKERSRSKERKAVHGKRTVIEDDEDWQGENEEEKQRLAGIKSSKRRKRLRLRSPNEEKAMDIEKSRESSREEEEEEDDNDENEDGDLEGFIVGDEEEETPLENDKDEEELLDATSSEDDDNESDTEQEETNGKPFCKYGKGCYRKNKEHLAKFQHSQ